ncbi:MULTISPECIES: aldo/keto reductase [unclassified Bradyrhizobium]
MQYRELGRSGLKLSVLCLGTMSWGEQNEEAEAHAQLDAALDAGINSVDTAEMYPVPPRAETHGFAERYIGSWLRKTRRRQDVVLATKAVGPVRAGKANLPYVRQLHTRQSVRGRGHQPAKDTEYIDLYQMHWPDGSTNVFQLVDHQYQLDEDTVPILETLEALNALVRGGRVSSHQALQRNTLGTLRARWFSPRDKHSESIQSA